jgi:hypothetical protein
LEHSLFETDIPFKSEEVKGVAARAAPIAMEVVGIDMARRGFLGVKRAKANIVTARAFHTANISRHQIGHTNFGFELVEEFGWVEHYSLYNLWWVL